MSTVFTSAPVFTLAYPNLNQERQGNTGTEGVWHFDSGLPGKHVMLSALIHGNELCGAWALKDFLATGLRPRCGQLTLVFCNLAAYDRFDPQQYLASRYVDEDMNRVWSDDKLSNPTSYERRRAAEILPWLKQADWLLDFHSMSGLYQPLQLTGVQHRHIEFAQALGNPQYIISDAGHQAGVRMRDYGRFSDPLDEASRSLLIECGFHGEPRAHEVALDMMARFLAASGLFEATDLPAQWRLPDSLPVALEVTDAVTSVSGDFKFAKTWDNLECVATQGTILGWAEGQPVCTPYDNCYLIMPLLNHIKPGVTVVRLARLIR